MVATLRWDCMEINFLSGVRGRGLDLCVRPDTGSTAGGIFYLQLFQRMNL